MPFSGEAKSRDVIIRYELFHESKREPKYHVLVTTYETVTNSRDFTAVFKTIGRWEVLVVDEGQRRECSVISLTLYFTVSLVKSDSSLLFKKLNELKPIHRVIMTGVSQSSSRLSLTFHIFLPDPTEQQYP